MSWVTCDPKSTCPTSCNDNNACTTNVLVGSSTTCNATCSYPAITSCTALLTIAVRSMYAGALPGPTPIVGVPDP